MPTALTPTYEHASDTPEGRIERAVHILCNEPGDKNTKVAFLRKLKLSDREIRDALKEARPKRREIVRHRAFTFTSEF